MAAKRARNGNIEMEIAAARPSDDVIVW